jgi:hypothetical protein
METSRRFIFPFFSKPPVPCTGSKRPACLSFNCLTGWKRPAARLLLSSEFMMLSQLPSFFAKLRNMALSISVLVIEPPDEDIILSPLRESLNGGRGGFIFFLNTEYETVRQFTWNSLLFVSHHRHQSINHRFIYICIMNNNNDDGDDDNDDESMDNVLLIMNG